MNVKTDEHILFRFLTKILTSLLSLWGARMLVTGVICCGIIMVALPAAHAQSVIYVNDDAGGANDGTSWGDAYTDLQNAIDAATGSDVIAIAAGMYVPGSGEGDSFTITQNGYEIYGGYAGNEAISPGDLKLDERNFGANPTVLSGDIGDDDTKTANGVTLTADDIVGGNSDHVFYLDDASGQNITSATHINGVTITGGQGDYGGGIYCHGYGHDDSYCSPTITNVIFAGNYADIGGALYNGGTHSGTSSPGITNVIFYGNHAAFDGGAILNDASNSGTSNPELTNVIFYDNQSDEGGAIFNRSDNSGLSSSQPVIINSIFYNNTSESGDAIFNYGQGAKAILSHTLIQGGVNGSGVGEQDGGSNDDAGNNLDTDPQFVDPSSPAGDDGIFGTADDGLRVEITSPLLDAGDNGAISGVATDITGVARIQDAEDNETTIVDIGAYEKAPPSSPVVDLALGVSTDKPFLESGQNVTFILTLTNNDADEATGIEISAKLPENLTYVSDTGGASYDHTSGTWTVSSLAGGQTTTLEVTATRGSASPQRFTGEVTTLDQLELITDNNKASNAVMSPPDGAGQAITLDGSDDRLLTPVQQNSLQDGGPFTVSLWIKAGDQGSYTGIIQRDEGSLSTGEHSWKLGFDGNGSTLRFDVFYDATNFTTVTSDGVADGQWHHVAAAYDGTDISLYIDGEQTATKALGGEEWHRSSASLYIGNDSCCSGRFLNGTIEEVRLWTTARTQQQIRANMHRILTGQEANLAAYYNFDAESNTTSFDWAGSHSSIIESNPQHVVSGAPIGQASVLANTTNETSLGEIGGKVSATPVSADADNFLTLYTSGSSDSSSTSSGTFADDIIKRSDLVWGVVETGDITADLVFSYGNVNDINPLGGIRLLKRSPSSTSWQDVTDQFTRDTEAQTFTANGITDFGQFAIGQGELPPGVSNRSLTFDGSDDEVIVSSFSQDASPFTVSAWIKAGDQGSYTGIIQRDEGSLSTGTHSWKLGFDSDGTTLRFDVFYDAHNFTTVKSSELVADGQWHHVAGIYDGTNIALYVDGRQTGITALEGEQPNQTDAPLRIGNDSCCSGRFLDGLIDEVRIWSMARTQQEIQQNAFQPLDGNETGLAGYWPLVVDAGSTIKDHAGNHDGDLLGGATWNSDVAPSGTFISGSEGWRMMTSPADGTSYGTLLDTLWTQGFTGADVEHGAANVLIWNEVSQQFEPISDASEVPGKGTGFIVYVYNDQDYDDTPDGFPKSIRVDHSLNSGATSPDLSYTEGGVADSTGWNLVGNPYGATINWNTTSGWTRENLDASFYVWNASAGAYQSHNGESGTLPDSLIAPWQGFWVKANGASPTLGITDEVRSAGGQFLKDKPTPQIELVLKEESSTLSQASSLETNGQTALESKAVVMFSKQATPGKDPLDAWKLQPLNSQRFLSLYTTNTERHVLDINALPTDIESPLELHLDFKGSDLGGEYRLSWNPQKLPDSWTEGSITLTDLHTDRIVGLTEAGEYSFEISNNHKKSTSQSPPGRGDSGEAGSGVGLKNPSHGPIPTVLKSKTTNPRFVLTVDPNGANSNMAEIPDQIELDQNYPNPFNPTTIIRYGVPRETDVQLNIYDVLGRKVQTLVNEQKVPGRYEANFNGSRLASGLYFYRLTIGSEVLTKKMMLIK